MALVLAFGVFLPAHWASEAREGTEHFGWLLCAAALTGASLIVGSVVRVTRALRASQRFQAAWHSAPGTPDRIVEDAALPGMSLAGVVRTIIVTAAAATLALTLWIAAVVG